MIARTIGRLLGWGRHQPRNALQVEVTTHCSLRCTFCPHEALRSSWTSQHMPLSLFDRLVPDLPNWRFVHLQGWGEPLLHPELPRMVEVAKSQGCQVGLTTNGMLLGREMSRELVRIGTDLVAVSLAGATASTNDRLRKGSELGRIVANVTGLAEEKRRCGTARPRIVLLYMMLRSSLAELPLAVEMASKMEAQEVVATNLDYVVNDEQDAERVFSTTDVDPTAAALIHEAEMRAASLRVLFRPYPLTVQHDVVACEAVATPTAVVAADGGLFPCVYTSLPVDPIPRLFLGSRYELPRRPLGSIAEADLSSVLGSLSWRTFHRVFELRQGLARQLAMQQALEQEFHWEPSGRARAGESILDEVEKGAPLPVACRSCYKALGI